MPRRIINLRGGRFGCWLVLGFAGTSGRKSYFNCRCDCGTEKIVCGNNLRSGATMSCGGCLPRPAKHGARRRGEEWPEYGVWAAMIDRCHNPDSDRWKHYGGRGITVCDRWRFGENGMSAFSCYIADLGRRPSGDVSVDRKDNDGNYEPGNCRYATAIVQRNNRRDSARNRLNRFDQA